MKYNLWEEMIHVDIIPPTTVKKFATGKGNASKEDMFNKFNEENPNIDLRGILTPRSTGVISPLNDIVDAFVFSIRENICIFACCSICALNMCFFPSPECNCGFYGDLFKFCI